MFAASNAHAPAQGGLGSTMLENVVDGVYNMVWVFFTYDTWCGWLACGVECTVLIFPYSISVGLGWGTGIAIAHRAMDAVVGPLTFRHETVTSEAAPSKAGSDDACSVHSKAFQDVRHTTISLYKSCSVVVLVSVY